MSFNFLKSAQPLNQLAKKNLKSQFGRGFESLEDRRLLAVDVFANGAGTWVNVVGEDVGEAIVVSEDGGNIRVDVDGTQLTDIPSIPLAGLTGVVVRGNGGDDVITIDGSLDGLRAQLYGGSGDDVLTGANGMNRFYGQSGTDEYAGGSGKDHFFVDELDVDFAGGDGRDRLYFTAERAFTTFLTDVMSIEEVIGTSGNDNVNASATTFGVKMLGHGGDDTFAGGSGDDYIVGAGGNDTLIGGGGTDVLRPGIGINTVVGDAFDILSYTDLNDGLDIDLTVGTVTGISNTDTLLGGIVNVDGTNGDDIIRGTADANRINAKGGDDIVFGSAGADKMFGGGQAGDTINYSLSPGGVTVRLSLSKTNGSGGDATGDVISGFENAVGSEFNDTIVGSIRANILTGLGGNDVIQGREGDDLLLGGDGNDTLNGGAGVDEFNGGDGDDRFTADASDVDGSNNFLGVDSSGNDELTAKGIVGVNWILPAGFHMETVRGTAVNDVIDASNYTLSTRFYGLAGSDILTGGTGDDFIYGGDGDDDISGGDGRDRLFGQIGDDILDGGDDGIKDFLTGGTGADTFTRLGYSPLDVVYDFSVVDGDIDV